MANSLSGFIQESIENAYELGEEIGSGQFAVVRRCRHKATSVEYAAKIIRKRRLAASRRGAPLEDIHREVQVLSEVNHESIVKLYEVYETKQDVTLVLELVSGGEMFEYLADREKVTEIEAVLFIRQILDGIEHLHQKQVVHLDLKPENLMLVDRKSSRIKIIDFGLSRKLLKSVECREMLGTPEFVAPEVINFDPLSLATDMWSIGVLTYILLSGCSPFLGSNKLDTLANVSSLNFSLDNDGFDEVSQEAKDFISRLLVKNPRKRATVHDCLSHSWICQAKSMPVFVNSPEVLTSQLVPTDVREQTAAGVSEECILRSSLSSARDGVETQFIMHHSPDRKKLSVCDEEPMIEGSIQKSCTMLETPRTFLPGFPGDRGSSDIVSVEDVDNAGVETPMTHLPVGVRAEDVVSSQLDDELRNRCESLRSVGEVDEELENILETIQSLDDQFVNLTAELMPAISDCTNVSNKLNSVSTMSSHQPLNCRSLLSEQCVHPTASVECRDSLNENSHSGSVSGSNENGKNVACVAFSPSEDLGVLLHKAVNDCNINVVRYLLERGTDPNSTNQVGETALHRAVKLGQTEITQYLLLHGANTELCDAEGRDVEVAAIRSGYSDIIEMVTRMSVERSAACAKQLKTSSAQFGCVKLKVFGNCGVGKTALIESLKCGYIGGWLRSALHNGRSVPSSTNLKFGNRGGTSIKASANSSHYCSMPHSTCTRGIEVENCNISGVGQVSVWEFSGYEKYYVLYDHFIGDINCIHLITISLCDSIDVQLTQLLFWIDFIRSRVTPQQQIGYAGRLLSRPHVIVVAMHADEVTTSKCDRCSECNHAGLLIDTIMQKFNDDIDIYPHLFTVDAFRSSSPEMKTLRRCLDELKSATCQAIPPPTSLLDATVSELSTLRRRLSSFPAMSWPKFAEYVRLRVNVLCTTEHMHQLIFQLQVSGEIIYLNSMTAGEDLIVINPRWLCHDVIGYLLSRDIVSRSRPTGHYSADEMQLMLTESDGVQLVHLLESLELCYQMTYGDELEFPCYNSIEMNIGFIDVEDADEVLSKTNDWVYGGTRLNASRISSSQLAHVFPRVQTRLRRGLSSALSASDCILEQWSGGSRCTWRGSLLQAVVSVSHDGRAIDVSCRAYIELKSKSYVFCESLVEMVIGALEDCVPGIVLDQYLLNPSHLASEVSCIRAYSPKDIRSALTGGVASSVGSDRILEEDLCHLLAFGCCEVFSGLIPGTSLSVAGGALSHDARRRLSRLLDPPDATGRDWCLLAVWLGIDAEDMAAIDSERCSVSPTDRCISLWSMRDRESATVSALIDKLTLLGRNDAINVLLEAVPLYVASTQKMPSKSQLFASGQSQSYESDLTVSSTVSR